MNSEQKLLPTDPYDQLLAQTIEKVKQKNKKTAIKRKRETFKFPNRIERDIKMVILIKIEVLNPLIDWPFNYENEKLKTSLACDLIVWYRNKRPDLLHALNSLL